MAEPLDQKTTDEIHIEDDKNFFVPTNACNRR